MQFNTCEITWINMLSFVCTSGREIWRILTICSWAMTVKAFYADESCNLYFHHNVVRSKTRNAEMKMEFQVLWTVKHILVKILIQLHCVIFFLSSSFYCSMVLWWLSFSEYIFLRFPCLLEFSPGAPASFSIFSPTESDQNLRDLWQK